MYTRYIYNMKQENEKFTPGPVTISRPYSKYKHRAYEVQLWEGISYEDAERHGQLAYAAPYMHEALEEALFYLKLRPKTNTHIISKVESALAKAEL